jgi:hypothetical protein
MWTVLNKESIRDVIRVTVQHESGAEFSFEARTKAEFDRTLRNLARNLASRDEEIALIPEGEYALDPEPTKEVVAAEPDPEAEKRQEIAQAEHELFEEVERVKRETEIAELAKEHQTVAERVAALEAVRNK